MKTSKKNSALPLCERRYLKQIQKLQKRLCNNNSNNESSEQKQKYTRILNKIKDIQKQRKLVKNPINYSQLADPIDDKTEDTISRLMGRIGDRLPNKALVLLKDKLIDKFGASYASFVGHMQDNIWLQVLLKFLQEDIRISDERMAEMHPLCQLLFIAHNTTTADEEWILKVLIREFDLHLDTRSPVEDIINELVDKMGKRFAEVAPVAEAVAVGVRGINLTG